MMIKRVYKYWKKKLDMPKAKVSVIVPAYNEEKVLEKNIRDLDRRLGKVLDDYEIIISEDGSTDKTAQIAKSLESGRIRISSNGKRKGKGAAIRCAAAKAEGNSVFFMDADLASDLSQLSRLLSKLESGTDIVIGSRYLKESKAKRNFIRHFASKSFNTIVRLTLNSKIRDHQCGFKAFRKDSVLPVIEEVDDQRYFWDTELLVRAQRKGLKIEEIPIEWKEADDSKYRLIRDTVHMARSLISFRLKKW